MKRLACLLLLALFCVFFSGCGGLPKPAIKDVPAAAGTANVRLALVASNFDSSWESEKVKLYVRQQWLNNQDVPVNEEAVGDKAYFGAQGSNRGSVKLKDAKGNSTRDVVLAFELKSGPDPLNQNVSANAMFKWGMGAWAETDLTILCVVSRTGNNSYAIDAAYAVDLASGKMEQLLPRNK